MVINAIVALALVWHLAHVGLALATSIAGLVNAALLYRKLKRSGYFEAGQGWARFLVRLVFATIGMAVALYFGQGGQIAWLEATLMERVARLFILIIVGAIAYFGSLYLMRVRVHQLLERP